MDYIKLFPVVFLGGGLGATLRWVSSLAIFAMTKKIWLGTLIVNLIGCLIFSLFHKNYNTASPELASFVRVGVLGSLTTFSTFAFEVVNLMKDGRYLEGSVVIFLNVLTGIIIGVWILR